MCQYKIGCFRLVFVLKCVLQMNGYTHSFLFIPTVLGVLDCIWLNRN